MRIRGRNGVLTNETSQKQSPKKPFVGMCREIELLVVVKQKSREILWRIESGDIQKKEKESEDFQESTGRQLDAV